MQMRQVKIGDAFLVLAQAVSFTPLLAEIVKGAPWTLWTQDQKYMSLATWLPTQRALSIDTLRLLREE